jgi:hypothetical protein
MGDFHQTLLKDRNIATFCPKLDDCTPLRRQVEQSSLPAIQLSFPKVESVLTSACSLRAALQGIVCLSTELLSDKEGF